MVLAGMTDPVYQGEIELLPHNGDKKELTECFGDSKENSVI